MRHRLCLLWWLLLTLCLACPWWACAQQGMVINGSRTIYGAFNTGVDTGSTDAYVITLSPPIPNYIVGTQYTFLANTANTGACSLNIDARGVLPIKVRTGSVKVDPASNAICAGQYVDVIYDGVDFQMLSQPCTAAAGGIGDALVANPLSQFAATTSAQLAGVLTDEKGTTGGFARIDGLLVVASGKTVTQQNTVTYTATDGSSVAFGGGGTVAYTSGNVATATALAADPTACGGGQFVTDIAANGTLTCSTPAGGGTVSTTGTPTAGQLPVWTSATLLQGVATLPAANMPAHTGDVTNSAGSLATTISAGVVTLAKMADLPTARLLGRSTAGTGVPEALTVLPAALEPAHVGDVTNSAGSLTLTLANIPTATPLAGSLLATAMAAPGTPAAGKGSVYVDSTSKNLAVKDDAGVVKHGVQTITCSGQFVSAINDAGLPTCTSAAGGGTVTSSGTPTSGQVAVWTSSTNAQGVTALASSQLPATTVYTNQANTWSTGAQNFAAAASLIVPSAAGAAPTADGDLRYDTTRKSLVVGHNTDATLPVATLLCAGSNGSTNNASTGAGADVAHTPSCTVPANFLTLNKVLQICVQYTTTTTGSAPTIAYKLKAGATTLDTSSANTSPASITSRSVIGCYQLIASAAPGASVNVYTSHIAHWDAVGYDPVANTTAQPVALATNGALVLTLATQWGSTSAGNTIQLASLAVLALN